jgi:hypothetical protein
MNGMLNRMWLVLFLALGIFASSARPAEGQLSCYLCFEYLLNDELVHSFETGSYSSFWCQSDPGYSDCRACGGSSSCHTTPDEGECHVSCGERFAAATAEITTWLASESITLNLSDPTLAVYNPARRTLQLSDCNGRMTAQWTIPEGRAVGIRSAT